VILRRGLIRNLSMNIWFHNVDRWGNNDDYSVTSWEAAKEEALSIIKWGIHLCDKAKQDEINELIAADQWKEAVEVYNDSNWLKEWIRYAEEDRPEPEDTRIYEV
jgi:hypothetical protein